jgi:thiol-disulfide isomerase/thioredoxin
MRNTLIKSIPMAMLVLGFVFLCSCGQGSGSKLTSKAWEEFKVVANQYDSLMTAINKLQKENPEYKTNPQKLQEKLADKMEFIQDLMKKIPEKAEPAIKELTEFKAEDYNASDLKAIKLAALATQNLDYALRAGERLLTLIKDADEMLMLKKELVQLNIAQSNVTRAAELATQEVMADMDNAEQMQLYMSFASAYADVPDLQKARTYAMKCLTSLKDVQTQYEKQMAGKDGQMDPQQKMQLMQSLNQAASQALAPVMFAFKNANDEAGRQSFVNEAKTAVGDDARWSQIEAAMQPQIEKLEKDNAALNKPAAEWAQHEWIGTDPLSLAGLKGKVVLIDFFATWCKPCIAAFPHMKEWQDKYGPKGLMIVGLTTYQSRFENKEVKPEEELLKVKNEFMPKNKITWPVGIEKNGRTTMDAYGVQGIPHMVLIDKKGMIRYFKTGAGDFAKTEAKIQALLAEN